MTDNSRKNLDFGDERTRGNKPQFQSRFQYRNL